MKILFAGKDPYFHMVCYVWLLLAMTVGRFQCEKGYVLPAGLYNGTLYCFGLKEGEGFRGYGMEYGK